MERLYEILRGYPGKCRVELVLTLADGSRVDFKSEKVRIAVEPELRTRLDDLLGPGQVRSDYGPTGHRPASGPLFRPRTQQRVSGKSHAAVIA